MVKLKMVKRKYIIPITTDGILNLGESYFNKKKGRDVLKSLLDVGSTVGSKNISNNQFYSISLNKLILLYKYGGGGRI